MAASSVLVASDVEPVRALSDYFHYVARHRSDMVEQIRKLSRDPAVTFLVAPITLYNFNLHTSDYVPLAMELIRLDPELDRCRLRLVPRRIKETHFWRNYLSRVYALAVRDSERLGWVHDSSEENLAGVENRAPVDAPKVVAALAELRALVEARQRQKQQAQQQSETINGPEPPAFDVAAVAQETCTSKEPAAGRVDDVLAQFKLLAQAVAAQRTRTALQDERDFVTHLLRQCADWIRVAHASSEAPQWLPFVVQAVLTHELTSRFPGNLVLAKESALALRAASQAAVYAAVVEQSRQHLGDVSEDHVMDLIGYASYDGGDCARYWVLWPQSHDGGVHVALVDSQSGEALLGCILDAARGVLIVGEKGAGAQILPLTDESTAVVAVGKLSSDHLASRTNVHVEEFIRGVRGIRKPADAESMQNTLNEWAGAACTLGDFLVEDVGLLLRDDAEPIGGWEFAAGTVVAQEMGARVTDISGRPLHFRGGRMLRAGVLAASASEHDGILQAISSLRRPPPRTFTVQVRGWGIHEQAVRRAVAAGLGIPISNVEVTYRD